jgi:glycosyltransferase involved in cell wall biosynthesis
MSATVSVIMPCYNEEGTLRDLHARVREILDACTEYSEILFVDDGSADNSTAVLRALATEDPHCRVIMFRRNCGKAAALQAGFQAARGEILITMDADLQDDPAEIPRFIAALQDADLVVGWKRQRHDPLEKRLASRIFNATVGEVTGVRLHDMNCGFKAMRRQVADEIMLYGDLHRYLPVLAAARGFRVAELPVTHHPRRSGTSKYGWERHLHGFLDLFTTLYLTRYHDRPFHLFGRISAAGAGLSLIIGAALCVPLSTGHPPAWQFALWLLVAAIFTASLVLWGIGLLAEVVIAGNASARPAPPIAERLNMQEDDVALSAAGSDHGG